MKIARKLVEKKINYAIGRLGRAPWLSLNELQRRIVARFGQQLARPTLRSTVQLFRSLFGKTGQFRSLSGKAGR
jgi:hypothetical protein